MAIYRRSLFGSLVLVAGLVLLTACDQRQQEAPAEDRAGQPNIVLIIIDDMGYNDLGANGNASIVTPNLDKLATEGVRFTRHYTDSTCTATRIGAITGSYPARHGFRPDNLGISPEVITLPEVLREAGYSTHHIGKWHMGFASRLAWPNAQGFDTFFGFLNQFLMRNPVQNGTWAFNRPTFHNPWLQENEQLPRPYKGHLSAILADRAVEFIEQRAPGDKPWFLNFWTYAPHTPIEPMAEFAAKYPDTPAGHYRAVVEQVDYSVGRIMAKLEEKGLTDSTLVIVVSDNGGTNKQIDNNAPYFGTKASFYEGGVRTPMIMRWPGRIPEGQVHAGVVSNFDYFPTLAMAAGAALPPGLAGTDLVELIHNPQQARPALYWESGNSQYHSWSTLSADGHWRMTQHISGAPELYDLNARPAGDQDVAPEHAHIMAQLHSDFLAWRQRQRPVDLIYERRGERGIAQVSGESFERTPGFAGHTFAIDLTPDENQTEDEQIIALQPGQWQLSQVGDTLVVTMQGLQLEAPVPQRGRCSTVVVASHFGDIVLYRKSKRAVIEVFINSERVAQLESSEFGLPPDDFLDPTFIGADAVGKREYQGQLGKPLMFNERLVSPGPASAKIASGVDTIQAGLCTP